ncbi:PIG-L family deacetylase [Nodularia sp. UHCC 0506]|uniref:PIG-L deacetylase family protein n=1 Tax=Nodularia sp. UHCC 0506 TaxID=3110243 RepID=UPI002B21C096|nr:PIG-L family deacetylase [Nodularia sp. UHCC 0506]MEA5515267.1 PIG-L family deacetylase [Nodularia sp. UHCC 0506]
MAVKTRLKSLQSIFPYTWLEQLQYIHSRLLCRWILLRGIQPLEFNQKSAMVFSPHQDDETFGCGGMIAHKREQGIPVIVVFLTDGQGLGVSDSQKTIVEVRQQEAQKALGILGVEASNIHFLAKLDGNLKNLNYEEKQQTISQLSALIQYYQPEEVYVPHHKDCHTDHEATYELVKAAISDEKLLCIYAQNNITIELIQYPIWLFWRAPLFILLKLQDIAAAHCFSITPVQAKKTRAIASYVSQMKSLPRGFINRFLDSYEIFFKAD